MSKRSIFLTDITRDKKAFPYARLLSVSVRSRKAPKKTLRSLWFFLVTRWLAQRLIFSCSHSSRQQLFFKRLKFRLRQQASVEQLFEFEQLVGS